jgi:hypothetical protein
MEKENNRRRAFISALISHKLAYIDDSNTVVIVSPKEVEKEPERGIVFNVKPIKIVTDITTVINENSTGGKHKGGKKNKRNKRW